MLTEVCGSPLIVRRLGFGVLISVFCFLSSASPKVISKRLTPKTLRTRQTIRRSLSNLQNEKGDIRALEGELEGFCRLRVLRYRIIFFYHVRGKSRSIRCVYAAPRGIVYEVFAQSIRELLR